MVLPTFRPFGSNERRDHLDAWGVGEQIDQRRTDVMKPACQEQGSIAPERRRIATHQHTGGGSGGGHSSHTGPSEP